MPRWWHPWSPFWSTPACSNFLAPRNGFRPHSARSSVCETSTGLPQYNNGWPQEAPGLKRWAETLLFFAARTMVALEQRQPILRVRNFYAGGLNHNERRCRPAWPEHTLQVMLAPFYASTPLSGRRKSNWLAITARLIASHDLLVKVPLQACTHSCLSLPFRHNVSPQGASHVH